MFIIFLIASLLAFGFLQLGMRRAAPRGLGFRERFALMRLRAETGEITLLHGDAAVAEGSTITAAPRRSPDYLRRVAEAAQLFGRAMKGNRRAALDLQEAMSTSDFPNLLGAVFGRELLATYQQLPQVWSQFASRKVVNDFRPKTLVDLLGGRTVFDRVPEFNEYPARKATEAKYSLAVGKFGARIPWSWEMGINDDLGALQDLPQRLAQGARDTEDFTATSALATSTGPSTAFFKAGNNTAADNKPLTTDNLQAALTTISTRKDSEGRPIQVSAYVLMVPPGLEVVANNIVNALQIRNTVGGQTTIVQNWLAGKVKVVVNPWLSIVDTSGTSATTWYLLPAPETARPAVALGFLRGHEVPDLRVKSDGGNRLGGGAVAPEEGSFENDDIEYRARHVLGSTPLDPIATYASKGA